VRRLARADPPVPGARGTRLSLVLRGVPRRSGGTSCLRAPVRAHVVGADLPRVRRVDFRLARLGQGAAVRSPFTRPIRVPRSGRVRVYRVMAAVRLRDGRRVNLSRLLRACAA
jgi:hypothetical protein